MPRFPIVVTLALGLTACTSRFAWNDPALEDVEQYRAAFDHSVGDHFVAGMPEPELLQRLSREPVLWLGDHHSSVRLHTLQLALLRALQASGVPLTLQLEAIGTQDEPIVRDFLAGSLSLDGVRQRLRSRWPGSWLDDDGVDAAFYRQLLVFAREHQLPVCALEPTPRVSLAQRDPSMAAAVRTAAQANGGRLLVVVVGQAHLAGVGNLPRRAGIAGLCLGGEPVPSLRTAVPPQFAGAVLLQSDAGLWWFAALLAHD